MEYRMAKQKMAKKNVKSSATAKPAKPLAKAAKPTKAPVKEAKPVKASAAKTPRAAAPAKVVESTPVKVGKAAGLGATKLSLKLNEAKTTQPVTDLAPTVATKPVKPARRSRQSKAEEASLDKSNQLSQKWSTLYRKSQDAQPLPYNMRGQFEAKTAIMHKQLGWGYILANKNDRLEVLFKDGIRFLISNYKS